jgi:hypothetical protein
VLSGLRSKPISGNIPAFTPCHRCLSVLHALAAFHVLRIAKLPQGGVSATDLNEIVAAFPQPAEAVRMLGLPIGNCPILFHDIQVKDLVEVLGRFIFEGDAPWPIFYMPTRLMEVWADDIQAKEFLAFLHKNGLDVQLTVSGPATWLRGHWCILCDMRLRFQVGVTALEMQTLALAKPVENPSPKSE